MCTPSSTSPAAVFIFWYTLLPSGGWFLSFFKNSAFILWECYIISEKVYKPPLFPICLAEKKKGQWECRIKQMTENTAEHTHSVWVIYSLKQKHITKHTRAHAGMCKTGYYWFYRFLRFDARMTVRQFVTFPHTNLLFIPFLLPLWSQTLQLNVYNSQNRLNDLHL